MYVYGTTRGIEYGCQRRPQPRATEQVPNVVLHGSASLYPFLLCNSLPRNNLDELPTSRRANILFPIHQASSS
jgi:fructosamine-3-kinase